jgi:hypothetical protein
MNVKSFLARLILYFAFGATAVAAMITFRHSGAAVLVVVVLTYLAVLVLVLAILLNYPRLSLQAAVNEFADDLEKQNLLVSCDFLADRAFRVEARKEEAGPHYFLELDDGSVLHLNGTYLYDYEPIPGSVPRHFPCTRFTVRRHVELGYVVDILCSGIIIEPEIEAPAFSEADFTADRVPPDGAILRDRSFEQIRRERVADMQSGG